MFPITNAVIGHRGASAYAPENTLAAFNMALSLGCHFLEFDVILSADEEPFVFHDKSLKRTTNGAGDIGLVNSSYLQSLDAGSWFSSQYCGEKIPHFRDVLQWLITTNTNANIEIKPYPGTAEKTTMVVISYLKRYWPTIKPAPLISSFDNDVLQSCKILAPYLPLGFLMHVWDKDWLIKAHELECYSLHINKYQLNRTHIDQVKAAGYKLFVYTVNNKQQAKKLLHWGVDAVFSDYPNLLS